MLATKMGIGSGAHAQALGRRRGSPSASFDKTGMLTEGLRRPPAPTRLADEGGAAAPPRGRCRASTPQRFRHGTADRRPARAAHLVALPPRAAEHRGRRTRLERRGGKDHLWSFPHDELRAGQSSRRRCDLADPGRSATRRTIRRSRRGTAGAHAALLPNNVWPGAGYAVFGKDVLLPIYKSRPHVVASPYLTGADEPPRPPVNCGARAQPGRRATFDGDAPDFATRLLQPRRRVREGEQRRRLHADRPHSRSFIDDIQRSTFCGVLMGNGWAHLEACAAHGCIRTLLIDGIDVQLPGVSMARHLLLARPARPAAEAVGHPARDPEGEGARDAGRARQGVGATPTRRCTSASMACEAAAAALGRGGAAAARAGMDAAALKARLGKIGAHERDKVFGPLEPRLRGRDAIGALVELLRLRLERRERRRPTALAAATLVDHGEPPPSYKPIPGNGRLPRGRSAYSR